MGKRERQRPFLHLVKAREDPMLYQRDLDLYYNVFDSMCGARSLYPDDMWAAAGGEIDEGFECPEDRAVRMVGRMRVVEHALRKIGPENQCALGRWYVARQYFPREYKHPTETEARQAHAMYVEARQTVLHDG
jgi:hypothetical protein